MGSSRGGEAFRQPASIRPPSMRTTPMLEQYWALKKEAPDAVLLYRLGDFYEMFYEDAEVAAPLLGLVLTARHKDSDIEAPMCGVPQHALETYVSKLIAAGKKVAITEQTELPGKGKTIVARRIVRIVTPGTVVDSDRLEARRANEIVSVARKAGATALATLDLSTGDFSVASLVNGTSAAEWIARRIFGAQSPLRISAYCVGAAHEIPFVNGNAV